MDCLNTETADGAHFLMEKKTLVVYHTGRRDSPGKINYFDFWGNANYCSRHGGSRSGGSQINYFAV